MSPQDWVLVAGAVSCVGSTAFLTWGAGLWPKSRRDSSR